MATQRGFTLLESLLAIVIFAIAFLGLSALQIKAIQLSDSGQHFITAHQLTEQIAEQINTNPGALVADGYFSTALENTACLGATAPFECTPLAMARHELFEWQAFVSTLPNGAFTICRDSTPNDGTPSSNACSHSITSDAPVAVKIWWQGTHDDTAQLAVLSFVPGGE